MLPVSGVSYLYILALTLPTVTHIVVYSTISFNNHPELFINFVYSIFEMSGLFSFSVSLEKIIGKRVNRNLSRQELKSITVRVPFSCKNKKQIAQTTAFFLLTSNAFVRIK